MSNHNHHHHHDSSSNPAQANREYYSSQDQIYVREKEFLDAFAARWTEEFLSYESWFDLDYPGDENGDTNLRMLDYAPGPGMVAFAGLKLKPKNDSQTSRFEKIIGVDVADGMVKMFNDRVAVAKARGDIEEGIEISSLRGDLISPSSDTKESQNAESSTKTDVPELDLQDSLFLPESQGGGFDLVTCSLAVHHFPDPAFSIKQLAGRLRKNGIMIICDMIPPVDGDQTGDHGHHGHHHGHHDHDFKTGFDDEKHRSTVPHREPLTCEAMEGMFKDAGLRDVKSRVMKEKVVMPRSSGGGPDRTIALVVGRRV